MFQLETTQIRKQETNLSSLSWMIGWRTSWSHTDRSHDSK
jgi:hypothetical protein